MLSVTIICVGKLKEKWLISAVEEYVKRLGLYVKLKIVELAEEKLENNPHPSEIAAALERESERIAGAVPPGAYTVALCIEGAEIGSEKFAEKISRLQTEGVSKLCLIIGGSFGLSERLKKTAAWRLSLSQMTFPHHLARVLLLEQLYRAFSILNGGKYHK